MPKAIYVKIGVSRWIVHCGRTDADGPSYGSLSQYKVTAVLPYMNRGERYAVKLSRFKAYL